MATWLQSLGLWLARSEIEQMEARRLGLEKELSACFKARVTEQEDYSRLWNDFSRLQADEEEHRTEIRQLNIELAKHIPPFEMDVVGSWQNVRIDEALAANIPKWGDGVSRYPLDSTYYIPSLEDTQRFIAWDWVDVKEYVKQRFDCENFALWLKARMDGFFHVNHVGFVIDWSSAHSYNLFLTPAKEVFLLEPQNDEYFDIKNHDFKDPMCLEHAIILI